MAIRVLGRDGVGQCLEIGCQYKRCVLLVRVAEAAAAWSFWWSGSALDELPEVHKSLV